MKKLRTALLVVLFSLVLVSCGKPAKETETTKSELKIVTTFYPMYEFTKQVVGEKAEVSMLIAGNTEPHDYEPSAKDIAKIQDADIFIYNSKEMETWVKSVLANLDKSQTTVIEASQEITLTDNASEKLEVAKQSETHAKGKKHGALDPHVWLDPVLAEQEVETITEGICKADPKHQSYYQKNSERYQAKLQQLAKEYETKLTPAKQRTFVTQHAAFGYLAKRYALNQVAITGLSAEEEPSPAMLAKIEDYIKKEKINTIYTEQGSSAKISQTISDATGAKIASLNTLEGLSKKQIEKGETYLTVMEDNLRSLALSIK